MKNMLLASLGLALASTFALTLALAKPTPAPLPKPRPTSAPHAPVAKPTPKPVLPSEVAPDPAPTGPFTYATGEYKFPAAVDPEILTSAPTEIWARVFWPKDLSKPRPILVFLHGNHSTCGAGAAPRVDSDCQYTHEGTCQEGMSVVPNHEGYNYLGQHLASHGYIVVSINANRGITCGNGDDQDWGLIIARGRLVLKHLATWYKWATVGGAPLELGAGANEFIGAVDFGNVGLLGHSRGGEGMRAAYSLYTTKESPWKAKIPGLDIRGIFEIGAVDGQAGEDKLFDADNTAWNQILPMCDGDVIEMLGRMPFERMALKKTELRPTPKSLYMVWGANHNFFNTEWQENDSTGCEGHSPIYGNGYQSEAQQKVALASATSFFLGHIGAGKQTSFSTHFNPLVQLPTWESQITRVDRDFMPTMDERFNARIEEFDQPTGKSSSGQPNLANGVKVEHQHMDDPKRASVKWTKPSRDNFLQLNWTAKRSGKTIDQFRWLDFRVARQDTHLGSTTPTDFKVTFVDQVGKLSTPVKLSEFAKILGPVNSTVMYQTVRIPLSNFKLSPGTKVRGIRFVFDQSAKADIYLASVRLTAPVPEQLIEQPVLQKIAGEAATTVESLAMAKQSETSELATVPAAATVSGLVAAKPIIAPKVIKETPAEFVGARMLFPAKVLGQIEDSTFNRVTEPTGAMPSSQAPAAAEAVEIEIRAPEKFPVSDALPILVIGGREFKVSRFDGKSTDSLIFKVPAKDLHALPESGEMFVQYGSGARVRRWRTPDFVRSQLVAE